MNLLTNRRPLLAPPREAHPGPGTLILRRVPTGRDFKRVGKIQNAVDLLGRLPDPGATWHCLIEPSKLDFFNVVEALLTLAKPASISSLYLATLGVSKGNAEALIGLLDTGKVTRCCLTCSLFWTGDARESAVVQSLRDVLPRHDGWFVECLAHSKIIAAELTDGRCFTAEGSANLRTCSSWEQFAISEGQDVFRFYQDALERIHNEAEQTARKG